MSEASGCGDVLWPPKLVQLPEWDNGGGIAVVCGNSHHRVVRRGDDTVALDHPDIDEQLEQAHNALSRGDIALLGFRYVDTGFLVEDLHRWRGRTWISAGPTTRDLEVGEVIDTARLAPCVRLLLEGFVPCMWCGRLLAKGETCNANDNALCVLSNGTGWRRSIPPGWVQATLCGVPLGLSRSWPYARCRNGPTSHVGQLFVSSPWWPELHPRRLKNLVCQYASDQRVTYEKAFNDVALGLAQTLGEMRPPPPLLNP